ncbi:amino acid ABC transporter substrate-binding protein [Donghicola sp. C2-DW-16]|uniref:Amino acid ABC transporter substrate-binding protein n=1 Tax=Donghicola mangrovi TaxID=2729614 RepID=A0A850Q0U3_9RHOB|nr:transporter substrate-binding domain-containing protein [Donghicola mangrovi]NVO22706.1 amino acid ABC transporter substrate-binding protein [Donghicola mangrovi]NVO27652.1 amino acid ABC transporter substrate-binding protein [Donghicola mangrovi]
MQRARALSLPALVLSLVVGGVSAAHAEDPCADFTPQAKPQNASRDIVGQDLDQIMEQGSILFAVYDDYAPYSWLEDGKPRGVDVDIAKLIAEYIGVEPKFNFVLSGENLEQDLLNNIWKGSAVGGRVSNVMMRIPYDSKFKCRVEQVTFTGQYAAESIAIAYDKASYPEDLPVPAYFRFDKVSVENDSISDFYLSGLAGGQLMTNIVRFPNMEKAMDALENHEVKASMGPLAQLEYGATDAIGIHQPSLAGFAVSKWTLGVGVHLSYKDVAYMVDDAIAAALADGRIAQIYADYGLTHQAPVR